MKRTYFGSCHCGKIIFEIDAEIDSVRVCNCSVCTKRGALIHRVDRNNLRLKTPMEDLQVYEWHTNTAKDYFCPGCGILPFRKPRNLTQSELGKGMKPFNGWAINVRCLDGLDLSKLPIVEINGKDVVSSVRL